MYDIHHRLDQTDAEGRPAAGYLGTYPGDTPAAALDAYAEDQGHESWADWPDAPEVVVTAKKSTGRCRLLANAC